MEEKNKDETSERDDRLMDIEFIEIQKGKVSDADIRERTIRADED